MFYRHPEASLSEDEGSPTRKKTLWGFIPRRKLCIQAGQNDVY